MNIEAEVEAFYDKYFTNIYFKPQDEHDKRIPKVDYHGVVEFTAAFTKQFIEKNISCDEILSYCDSLDMKNDLPDSEDLKTGIKIGFDHFKEQMLNKLKNTYKP